MPNYFKTAAPVLGQQGAWARRFSLAILIFGSLFTVMRGWTRGFTFIHCSDERYRTIHARNLMQLGWPGMVVAKSYLTKDKGQKNGVEQPWKNSIGATDPPRTLSVQRRACPHSFPISVSNLSEDRRPRSHPPETLTSNKPVFIKFACLCLRFAVFWC